VAYFFIFVSLLNLRPGKVGSRPGAAALPLLICLNKPEKN
jgi:hypothetical protein